MKRIATTIISYGLMASVFGQEQPAKKDSFLLLEPVEVKATRAGQNAPFTKTLLTKEEISKQNLGQDLPFLLNQIPSVVINSDAGNGIGYTGIRIRGTDASRINVTLNGIPFNDAESQGTFFVDLPDFSSSVSSIQVQRGVGTSSNGSGAFGATINISTNECIEKPYADFNNSYGSFNTWKNTIKAGSGLIDGHFTTDIRLSNISSDGYIDRARSKLQSLYFSTGYQWKGSSLRFNIFSGKEKTYQAWYGVSSTDLKNNRTINYAGTEKPGAPYDNETDNYQQDHFQLFFNHSFKQNWKFSTAIFYIRGKGYYEQYKAQQAYSDYGIPDPIYGNDTVMNTDLVRQLWLDNDYYGHIFSLLHASKLSQFTFGGGWNRYDGHHYGELVWAQNGLDQKNRWYQLRAKKTDINFYAKEQVRLGKNFFGFMDLQYRHVNYAINGFRDNPGFRVSPVYDFFNPKIGFSYQSTGGWSGYISYSRGQKEPNRDDFEAGIHQQPKPEKLNDLELGLGRKNARMQWEATLFYMGYIDQLVLTGKINDVGAYTRTNIPKSYRTGIELSGSISLLKWLSAGGNISISRNKISRFTEYVDDYDQGGQKSYFHNNPDIAYAPAIVSSSSISIYPIKNLEVGLLGKYVGKQYLDNTENEERKLDAFYVQDARVIYTLEKGILKNTRFIIQVNNIFNRQYEPNGYTYSYIYGSALTTENYYFPMAGTNFMMALNIHL
ncbi:MAG: TonB-dependent receptor plug domain-containing protein [Terrimonas sp.]|nr:TonB-dependent receptor plug domain-containing protein [Terrimonas sp.]